MRILNSGASISASDLTAGLMDRAVELSGDRFRVVAREPVTFLSPAGDGRAAGVSGTLAPTWGNAADGTEWLWSTRDAAGVVRNEQLEAESRLETELGYGLGIGHVPGVLSPYTGRTLGGASRTYRSGARWQITPEATLTLESVRAEGTGNEDPVSGFEVQAEARF